MGTTILKIGIIAAKALTAAVVVVQTYKGVTWGYQALKLRSGAKTAPAAQ